MNKALFIVAAVAVLRAQAPSGPIITTYAGTDWTFQADGQPAVNAPLGTPADVALDADGNVLIADHANTLVLRVSPDGTLRIVAGNGFDADRVGDGGDARSASINLPNAVGVGPDGSIYIGQSYSIRKVDPNGIIGIFAGAGAASFTGDGGPATQAAMRGPVGFVFDAPGNLFFSDRGNNRDWQLLLRPS